MPRRFPALIVAAIAGLVLVPPAGTDGTARLRAQTLQPAEETAAALETALKAARAGRWAVARRLGDEADAPLVRDLITWMEFVEARQSPAFEDLKAFLETHADWPRRGRLLARAEDALSDHPDDETVVAWFDATPPRTTKGQVRMAEALLAVGRTAEGEAAVQTVWTEGTFSSAEERSFRDRHRARLNTEDDIARLDRLLWDGHRYSAQRMLWRLKGDIRLLGEARLLLRVRSGNVDSAIAKVPAALRGHPGLVYERLRWRRVMGREDSAAELLRDPPDDLVRPDLWWTEKIILARSLLRKGHVTQAYELARDHRLNSGIGFADGEWFAGWIALRFLGEHRAALEHFVRMHAGVRYPVSLARAAYWAGRAAEAGGDGPLLRHWYGLAAIHATTYYGQLAAARLSPATRLSLPPAPEPDAATTARFERHDLARAAALLAAVDEDRLLDTFVLALGDAEATAEWRKLTAALARRNDRPDLAIRVAKDAAPDGHVLVEEAYPLLAVPPLPGDYADGNHPESPLTLAVIRQESLFRATAVSPANAQGLMQLLPSTARAVAGKLNLRYSRTRLTQDPAYNVTLGQAYLAELLDQFDGSYPLALAAYNAGPSRARQWIRDNGHPRDPSVDAVDWVEMIPFAETRNYVQRVLEGLQVYRDRLNSTEIAENLESDLER